MTRYAAPLAIGLIGIAILLWLGTWQIQRLAWKEAILDDIAQTIAGPSQPLPAPGKADPVTHRYQPVTLQGDIGDKALHVLVSVKRQGPGWRAISRLTVQDDRGATRHLLLDRGFVPVADKGRTEARGAVTLTG
ncbi:MAG: SURF1 family protein, partial [Paracoccaceae bacterium]